MISEYNISAHNKHFLIVKKMMEKCLGCTKSIFYNQRYLLKKMASKIQENLQKRIFV